MTIISSSPILVMSCAQPGTVSTTSGSSRRLGDLECVPGLNMAEAETRLALSDQELLGLAMMIVPPRVTPGCAVKYENWPLVSALEHLDEGRRAGRHAGHQ